LKHYNSKWSRAIKAYHIVEEVPFGGPTIDREARWLLHALKYGWPLDNFGMYGKEQRKYLKRPSAFDLDATQQPLRDAFSEKMQAETAELMTALAAIEPLTAPFEVIQPLFATLPNTGDAQIIHWFLTHEDSSTNNILPITVDTEQEDGRFFQQE